jgi:phospholipid/cholesterol/gamma-HCH transport system substrate-binding protein
MIGVAYVGARYVGFFRGAFANACTVHADFSDSGGIFSGAEVTYRGVTVGKVGTMHITPSGVRLDLHLDDCSNPKIPANAKAAVADRSVIGEQYVNLLPNSDNAPYLASGDVIPPSRTSIPIAAETFLTHVDSLITSVDLNALRTTVSELSAAFRDQAASFGSLISDGSALIGDAQQNLPSTLDLLTTSDGVLQTQLDERGSLDSFSSNLNKLAQQLKTSDPDIHHLLTSAPGDLDVLQTVLKQNRTDLGVLLADAADLGNLLVTRQAGIRQVLILYPLLPGGAESSIGKDGVAATGLVPNVNDPPDCGSPTQGTQGYETTQRRPPADTSSSPPNTSARCTASPNSGVSVRGSQNVPGGDPQ